MMFLMERQTVFLTGLVLRILAKITRMQNQQNGLLISEQVWTCTTLFLATVSPSPDVPPS
ncbi:hypothetical protein N879_15495 [Alcaligenes sp. EGD-AK7]|nr:hypothetical protein N879_15495 [Alcaligenes sp. EGD-AK7]